MDDPDQDTFPLGSFYVVVRVRPENEKERALGDRCVIQITGDTSLVFDPRPREVRSHNPGDHRYRELTFTYDRVFDQESTNNQVYEDTGRRLILPLLSGYNCSLFAYGATGSGKTHTMSGKDASGGGVIPNMIGDLFKAVEARKAANESLSIRLFISYLEIYNETIRDLLNNTGRSLPLQENPVLGTVVAGLTEIELKTPQEVFARIAQAANARAQGATNENATSSRSHAILQLRIEQSGGDSLQSVVSKLSLIDLAGSERAKKTSATGERLTEGININKSLLTLGNCINALVQASSRRPNGNIQNTLHTAMSGPYIPYRNSKLTRLLKDSLGGACKTIMIANVSPSSYHFDDTHSTLMYAKRAKSIRINAVKNVREISYTKTELTRMVADLTEEAVRLRKEVSTLRALLDRGTSNEELPRPDEQQKPLEGSTSGMNMDQSKDSKAMLANDIRHFAHLKQQLQEAISGVLEYSRELFDVRADKRRIQLKLRRLDAQRQHAIEARRRRVELPGVAQSAIEAERYTLQQQLRTCNTLEENANVKCERAKQVLLQQRESITAFTNQPLREGLLDILRTVGQQLKSVVAVVSAEMYHENARDMSLAIQECHDVFNSACVRAVDDLFGIAVIADPDGAAAALQLFNNARFSVDFLSFNYFTNEATTATLPPLDASTLPGASLVRTTTAPSTTIDVPTSLPPLPSLEQPPGPQQGQAQAQARQLLHSTTQPMTRASIVNKGYRNPGPERHVMRRSQTERQSYSTTLQMLEQSLMKSNLGASRYNPKRRPDNR